MNKARHYIDKEELNTLVMQNHYARQNAIEAGEEIPRAPEALGHSIKKISEKLSSAGNFALYSYRDEMILDGIEDCLKGLRTFKPEAVTRSGKMNTFGYFTQICFYAFLRRIAKEKKEAEKKKKYLAETGLENFMDGDIITDQTIFEAIRSKII